ncbi:DUF1707 SHOCT-like domain-containing protein [Saccharomonospora piscinae]|uniref:DUF1707 SHOCT-like domain-containing protein n=1 Tax=Saccharomonospora piscinae TaxID=687388 RepID=UPI0004658B55|nr:DUF1707 domain-containing protein [Saccharomonospora piscinae]
MNGGTDTDDLRIGTAERDLATRLLSDHFAQGRLSVEEYEDRAGRALAARTRRDVRPLFGDLPAPHPPYLTDGEPGTAAAAATTTLTPAPPAEMASAEVSDRSAVAAGVLQIVLPCGIGRFYSGHTRLALLQLIVTVLTFGLGAVWPMVDGILLLIHGGTDGRGRRLT